MSMLIKPVRVFVDRPEQERIIDLIDFTKKFIILEAPTGFGKTFLALRFHEILRSRKTLVLTTTKQLQLQYLEVSGHERLGIKIGRRAYTNHGYLDSLLPKPESFQVKILNYAVHIPEACDVLILDEADQVEDLSKLVIAANKIILLSATVLDPSLFLQDKNVIISPDDLCYIPSDEFPIDPEVRKIRFVPFDYVSYSTTKFDKLIRGMLDLLQNDLRDLRGLIHTVNFKLTMNLAEPLKKELGPDLLVHVSESNRTALFESFRNWRGRVLMSPSALRGLDLPGDRGRFAIFAKVPFPEIFSGSRGRDWYFWKTACSLVQGAGRCTRDLHDWSITYIVDANYDWFYLTANYLFPNWWKKSLEGG